MTTRFTGVLGHIHRLILVAVSVSVVIGWAAPVRAQSSEMRLPGHLPRVMFGLRALGQMAPTQSIDFSLWLPLRNQAALRNFLQRVYNPTDPLHGHFLTPAEFTSLYAPTSSDYQAVVNYARSMGFVVRATHANRLLVDVSASSAVVERALNVRMNLYTNADGRTFHAPDSDPAVPVGIAGKLGGFVGLDNAAKWRPFLSAQGSTVQAAGDGVVLSPQFNGTGFKNGLSPADIKKAYGYGSTSLTGVGQSVALVEIGGFDPSDISQYVAHYNLQPVPLQTVLVDGFSGDPAQSDPANVAECELDIELVNAIAPGLSKIYVYEGPNGKLLDILNQIATDNVARSVSISLGAYESALNQASADAENSVFMQMAAQGQSVFAASGDSGAYSPSQVLETVDPASQPWVCGVGATQLSIQSDQSYQSETSWNTPNGAGGGGISQLWPVPFYQVGAISPASKGSTTMRNVPDVSLDGDPSTGYGVYIQGTPSVMAGTSASTPLWAGIAALANQARTVLNEAPIGFLNPSLYYLASTSRYASDFHDISDGSTNGFYPAVPGYDLSTGLGSPIIANLLSDLSGAQPAYAPGPLTATALSYQAVSLSWVRNGSGEDGFQVERGTSLSTFNAIATAPAGSTSYLDLSVSPGVTYYYRVRSTSGAILSTPSNTVSVTTPVLPVLAPPTPQNVVATPGPGTVSLSWTLSPVAGSYTVSRSLQSGGPYTSLTPQVYVPAFTDSGLTNGQTYYYVVTATNLIGTSANSVEVSAKPDNLPAAPAGLTAVEGSGSVTLSWSTVAGATGYEIEPSMSPGGPFTSFAQTAGTTFQITKLTNGTTYYFAVAGVNVIGIGPNSIAVAVIPGQTAQPPTTPTDLTVTPGNAQAALSWTASPDATGYSVKRGTAQAGPFTTIQSGVISTSYTDTGLINGTLYWYVVSATNTVGESANSSAVSATPMASAPAAPTNLTITPGNAQAALSWTASPGATGYNVKRGTAQAGPFTTIQSGVISTSYTDTGLTNGTLYWYVVSATNAGGESANSSAVSAMPMAPAPAAPTNLTVTPGNAQAALSWTASAGATGYNVKRGTAQAGPFATIQSGVISTSYTDTGLTNGTLYWYVVSATNTGGESANSSAVSATPMASAPAAPANLTVTPGNAQAALSWTASPGATGYNVKRGTAQAGPFATIQSGVISTSYTDTGLTNGTLYWYVVSATNTGGESANSSAVSAMPMAPALPAAPTGVVATASGSVITITWSAVSGATGYWVKWALKNGGPFTKLSTITPGTSINLSGAVAGVTYYYEVSAVNAVGEGSNSAQVSVTPTLAGLPAAPTGVVATASGSIITITWNAVSGATGYWVKWALKNGGPFTKLSTITPGTSINLSGAVAGVTYYYEVSAVNAMGEGSNSAQVSVTPTIAGLPAAPTGVVATASGSVITITWSAVSGATGYWVKWALKNGGPFTKLSTITPGTSINLSGAVAGVTYYYEVSAVNAVGEGSNSAQVSVTPTIAGLPAAPTGVVATASGSVITITWSAVSGATGYWVKWALKNGGPFTKLSTITPGTSINLSGAVAGVTYYYEVSAVNAVGEGSNSAQVSVTPTLAGLPAAPIGVVATASGSVITITWNAVSGATGYWVKWALKNGGPFTKLTTITPGTSINLSGAVAGVTYYYEVSAVNAVGEGSNSAQVSVTPTIAGLPAAPTGLTATASGSTITITWNAVSGATGYWVKWALTNGGPFTKLSTITPGTSINLSGAVAGVTYYYEVSAVNAVGEGSNSAQVSVTD